MGKFSKWISDQGGVVKTAEKLGVTRDCIYRWLRGETSPKSVTAGKIISMSKYKVTFFDILHETKGKRK